MSDRLDLDAALNDLSDIPGNAADFAKSLDKLSDYVTGSVEQVIRKACIDLYRMIVERTPVDTGRAKANWQISTTDSDSALDEKNGFSFNEIKSIVEAEISDFKFELYDDQVIIYNNLEYIGGLENGTSAQAPYGMVSVSLVEFTDHFNRALAGFEGLEPA